MTTVKLKGRRRGAEPSINTCQGNKKENISTFYLEHFNGAICTSLLPTNDSDFLFNYRKAFFYTPLYKSSFKARRLKLCMCRAMGYIRPMLQVACEAFRRLLVAPVPRVNRFARRCLHV